MPPGNRLAPVTQNAFAPKVDAEGNQIPGRMPSPFLYGIPQFVGGVTRGLGTQYLTGPLQMVQQSYEDPYSLGQGIYEGARGLVADPVGVVGNSLRSMWNRAKSSPAGLGEVVGENIDPRNWLKPRKVLRHELDVYHGTPHTFPAEEGAPLGRFRSEKIGTGEGNQSYGYGLYLAEEPNVAKQYVSGGGGFISTQGKDNIYLDGKWVQDFSDKKSAEGLAKYSMSQSAAGMTVPEKIATLKKLGRQDAAEWLEKNQNRFSVSQGSLYKVDLPDAKIEQMLDWDKPISQQPAMQKAFNKFWKGLSKDERAQAVYEEFGDYDLAEQMAKSPGEVRGRLAYTLMTHHLGDPAAASEFLRQQGVPGIRYLDQGSRGVGQGTRNFVVFPGEEQHLNILSRD